MLSGRPSLSVGLLLAGSVFATHSLLAQRPAMPPRQPAPNEPPLTASQNPPSAGQVEVINGSSRWIGGLGQAPDAVQRNSRSPSNVDTVDVINGLARRTQVFDEEQTTPTPQDQSAHKKSVKRTPQKATEAAPVVPDVEVINGARWETRSFEGAQDEIASPWIERRISRPVVVGVESVETASRRANATPAGNTAPIVVDVASSESNGHGKSAKPVAFRIAPDPPKRPPYHPVPPGS